VIPSARALVLGLSAPPPREHGTSPSLVSRERWAQIHSNEKHTYFVHHRPAHRESRNAENRKTGILSAAVNQSWGTLLDRLTGAVIESRFCGSLQHGKLPYDAILRRPSCIQRTNLSSCWITDMTPDRTIFYGVNLIACGMFLYVSKLARFATSPTHLAFRWDYSVTLWFDLKFVRGKMKLRWPLVCPFPHAFHARAQPSRSHTSSPAIPPWGL